MRKSRFTEEQIAYAMKQAEAGTEISEIIRKMGVSEQTFYRWKKRYVGMGVAALRRMRVVEDASHEPLLLHQANDAFAADMLVLRLQVLQDPRAAVILAAAFE